MTKYGNHKVSFGGEGLFDSKTERDFFQVLKLQELGGLICNIERQVSVHLTDARILYKPDFRATDKNGEVVFFEVKGFETPTWRIKRRLWKYYGPGRLEVWKRKGKGFAMKEAIIPKGAMDGKNDKGRRNSDGQ